MRKPPLVHMYEHKEPGKDIVIVANKNGLLDLANALQHASSTGVAITKIFTGDGHETKVIVCKEGDDTVWENLEVPYTSNMFSEERDVYIPKEKLEPLEYYFTAKQTKE